MPKRSKKEREGGRIAPPKDTKKLEMKIEVDTTISPDAVTMKIMLTGADEHWREFTADTIREYVSGLSGK